MITGRVNHQHRMLIPIVLPDLVERELHRYTATIDTGLDHYLALPGAVIRELAFPQIAALNMVMGNEQSHPFEQFDGAVLWDGELVRVPILATETEFLVGARLLAGCHFSARIVPGGTVTIARIALP